MLTGSLAKALVIGIAVFTITGGVVAVTGTAAANAQQDASVAIESVETNSPTEGNSVEVDIVLRNEGDESTTTSLTVAIDGLGTQSTDVAIPGGETVQTQVTISTGEDSAGEYTVNADVGSDSADTSVTVQESGSGDGGEDGGENGNEDDGGSDDSGSDDDSSAGGGDGTGDGSVGDPGNGGGGDAIGESLNKLLGLMISWAEIIGMVVLLVGVIMFGTGTGGERSLIGKKLMFGGALIVLVSFGIPAIADLLRYLAPGYIPVPV